MLHFHSFHPHLNLTRSSDPFFPNDLVSFATASWTMNMSGCVSRERKSFNSIPDEVVLEILTYIPKDQFLSIRLVDKRFNRISKIGSLWNTVSFPGYTIYDENVLRPPRRKEVVVINIVKHHIAKFFFLFFFLKILPPPDMQILQVDLCFPRTEKQLRQLACHVLPVVGRHVRELKITGFHVLHDPWEIPEPQEPESTTLSCMILLRIKASCQKLKTLVIRKCRLQDNATRFGNYLPTSLENLSFIGCRYTHTPHVPNMYNNCANCLFQIFPFTKLFLNSGYPGRQIWGLRSSWKTCCRSHAKNRLCMLSSFPTFVPIRR